MQTNIGKITKAVYAAPRVERIKLDNEISLILTSEPPTYENVIRKDAPEFLNSDPFKNYLG